MQMANNLNSIDLNLLVVLDALLSERHVTRAALRLNKTQPAVSQALARLRALLDDPILIRKAGGLEPTARAQALAAPLGEALAALGGLVCDEMFSPENLCREFHISMSDYSAEVLLPGLVRRLAQSAPGAALQLVSLGREAAVGAVRAGEIDLAIGVYADKILTDDAFCSSRLFVDDFACLADGAAGLPATLEEYLLRPHVAVAASPDDRGEVDAALKALGHARRVAFTLPHWSVAPRILRGTALVLTAARRSLEARLEEGLTIGSPPIELPRLSLVQIWRNRRDHDHGLRWLRNEIMAEAREVG
ncbi:LysR family transcriptional regulator [Brevundimonas naejangsanensis]|uniref:LysR family transcriptional regulator n=1 Tax=Brevundimonas naejangsanensis TaxID=588932 RepID=UPI003207B884